MTTQYTPILKLALPVQGELSGTWGDTVNDNITSMVEEAIAGRSVINSWTTNSHTLTTADGTTAESRAMMLEFTDTGVALTGAGTVICPAASKVYICKNSSGQVVTIKTSGGTGVAVPNGATTFVFCDGTNVEECVTNIVDVTVSGTITLASGVSVSAILDEDNMASNSATALATQQSIKAYVDSQVGSVDTLAEVLANGNTTGGTDIVFGDNDKAVFGAGDDLKIYHTGSHSYIDENGTGNLYIGSNNGGGVYIQGSGENLATFIDDGAVTLYYDNAAKLATTSTGIDVTGTVTADGLTSSGLIKTEGTSLGFVLNETDTTDLNSYINLQSGNLRFMTANDAFNSFDTRLNINNATGDISFYEDTGTTAKFFWDASAESLGIGTASPSGLLHIKSTSGNAQLYVQTGDTTSKSQLIFGDSGDSNTGGVQYDHSDDSLQFHVGNIGEKVRIDASGNVGIGTTSPAANLEVSSATGISPITPTAIRISSSSSGSGWDLNSPWASLEFYSADNSGDGAGVKAQISSVMANSDTGAQAGLAFYTEFSTGGLTEKVRISPEGNVGIGTTSPSHPLTLQASGTSGDSLKLLGDPTNNSARIMWRNNTDDTETGRIAVDGSDNLTFHTGSSGSERARLDASGNLLVGKTSDDNTTAGAVLRSTGQISGVRNGNVAIILNRLSSDGAIAEFRKDGTTVGSIGAHVGDLSIGTGDVRLKFSDSGDKVSPRDNTDSARDGAIDLGGSSDRFKDLYLSGTAKASNVQEGVYNLTGTAIDPTNGAIQYKTLAANTTFTESLADGDSVVLRISGGATYTVTWPTMTWVSSAGNSAPTLGGSDVVVLWQESSVVYGAYVGSYA